MTTDDVEAPEAGGAVELAARWRIVELSRDLLDGVASETDGRPRSRVDVAVLPFFEDERPLQGIAGLIDWRGSGRLSSYLRRALSSGRRDEQLLTVGGPGLPADRIFMLGLGLRAEFDEEVASAAGARCVRVVVGLGARSVLIGMPVDIGRGAAERWFSALLEHDRAALQPGGSDTGESTDLDDDVEAAPHAAVEPCELAAPPASAGFSERAESAAQAEASASLESAESAEAVEAGEAAEASASPESAEFTQLAASAESVAPDDVTTGPDSVGSTGGTKAEGSGNHSGAEPTEPAPDQTPEDASGAGRATVGLAEADPERQARAGDQGEHPQAPSLSPDDPQPAVEGPQAVDMWWVVADARAVGRLRRVLSGPPRAASGA